MVTSKRRRTSLAVYFLPFVPLGACGRIPIELEGGPPELIDDAASQSEPGSALGADAAMRIPDASEDKNKADAGDATSESTDGRVYVGTCPTPVTFSHVGCLTTPAATLMQEGQVVASNGSSCTAEDNGTIVRLKACVSILDNPCVVDDEFTHCAIVHVARSDLFGLATGTPVSLNGSTQFTAPEAGVYPRPDPFHTTYVASQPIAAIVGAWMQTYCFCLTPATTTSQELSGMVQIDSIVGDRIKGRISLQASGAIPLIKSDGAVVPGLQALSSRGMAIDAVFDVPIVRSPTSQDL